MARAAVRTMLRFPFKATVAGTVQAAAPAPSAPWKPFNRIRTFMRVTNPAVDTNYILEVSELFPNKYIKMLWVGCTLTTDANVAARVVSLAYEPPRASLPTRMATWGSGRSIPANEVMEFFWAVGLHKDDLGTTIEHHQQGSLPDIYFPTNEMRLIIFVGERQVGDQLSNITYGWDEWDV